MKAAEKKFMEWLNEPWPTVSAENDNPLAEYVWHWLLEFRDRTEDGQKYGYYLAARNKVVAQAIEALQELLDKSSGAGEARPNQSQIKTKTKEQDNG